MPTIRILGGGAVQRLVLDLQERLLAEADCTVEGTFSAVGAMKQKLLAGEPCDVVILSREVVDELAATGHVVGDTRVDLGVVQTGVAVRAGDPLPAIGDGDALRATLSEATSLYHPDPKLATAGIHFIRVVERLQIRTQVESRLRPFPNGATAMRELAQAMDERPVGVTQVTEIRMTPGVSLAGVLPKGFELSTTYTAALCTRAESPGEAKRLLAMIGEAARGSAGRAAGFERAA